MLVNEGEERTLNRDLTIVSPLSFFSLLENLLERINWTIFFLSFIYIYVRCFFDLIRIIIIISIILFLSG